MTDVDGAAGRVWLALRALVLDDDRRAEACRVTGLSFARLKALRLLEASPRTLRELAAALTSDPPYTTVLVADLERRGLVTRTVHPTDRRARLVRTTPAGSRLAREGGVVLETPPPALVALPAADLADLERLLAALGPARVGR